MVMETPKQIHSEFYPWIKKDVYEYFQDFLNSDASIWLLMGPPGTGKTSLLRTFLHKNRLRAIVTYDEKLIKSDYMFVDFITSDNNDVLIAEDADGLLEARSDGNVDHNVVSRFLNISEGLIKFPKKKIIFTTNITDISQVDAALVRPGRCFDVLQFRALTFAEAKEAARAANIPVPEENQDYTLAQLFNPDEG